MHKKVRVPAHPLRMLTVIVRSDGVCEGRLSAPGFSAPCALGRGGISHRKREGDGATPAGSLRLRQAFYRPDRFRSRPVTALSLRPLTPKYGWCDDAASMLYNRLVLLPCKPRHENLWREDGLYDLIVVLDWNLRPRRRGHGSAIFLHCAREGLQPTEGCIALPRDALLRLLRRVGKGSQILIR